MKKIFLICLALQFVTSLWSQTQNVDSLINVLNTKELTASEQLNLYEEIGRYYVKNDIEKGIKYSIEGLLLAEKKKNKSKAAIFNRYIGVAYYSKSSLDTSFVYLNKSLLYALESKEKRLEMEAYGSLGNLYKLQRNYELAIDYYMKGLSLSDNIKDYLFKARTLSNLGTIHRALHSWERSIDYLEQALAVADQQHVDDVKMTANRALGTIYADKGENTKASEYFIKSLEISREIGDKQFEIINLGSLATCFSIAEDYDKALLFANESLQVAEKYGSAYNILGSMITLSQIYGMQGRYKECEEVALKAWALDSTSLEEGAFIALNIAIANIHLGNKEKAEDFVWKYQEIMANGNNKSLQNSLADMEVKYETEKKELRISVLEKEKQLYIWLFIVSGLAILMSLGVLFYRYRLNVQKRKAAEQEREIVHQQLRQLEQEKQLIATQSVLDGETSERSRLSRDLHDSLGGMLSVVKLNLEKELNLSTADRQPPEQYSKAMKMLDESIVELRRIAHHMMPESLMHCGLKVSLEDFCRAIPNAHFQFIGEDSRLDPRLEVMLYRCAYELINNAVKYANASNINIQLMMEEKIIALTVDDDGVGFDPNNVVSGTGLKNLRARVLAYNGKIIIRSAPEEGTEIIIEIEST